MGIAISIKPSLLREKLDKIIIIGSPMLAFLIIALFCDTRMTSGYFLHNPHNPDWLVFGSLLLTKSHIMLVFVRSHLNTSVFKRYPNRFISIPIIMLAALWGSPVFFGIMGLVAIYWDEWHSLMQTFGFGRIYDAKLGNDPHVGRKLDMGMAFVLGLLPHMILLTSLPEDVRLEGLEEGLGMSTEVAKKYGHYVQSLKAPLIAFGICYSMYYCWSYLGLIRNGYKFSKEKLALFASTGLSAGLIAALYSVTDAAYQSNIYHALQYYFIVYMSEGRLLPERLGRKKELTSWTVFTFFMVILAIAIGLAYAREKTENEFGFFASLWMLTSLLHFWYDGFIWSVRRQDI